jgi:ryanodine receptor 2
MSYEPRPIPTGDITLPEALGRLTERLVENAHDLSARPQLADGWAYGLVRDDTREQHRCLLPYVQLRESERSYDRLAAMDTSRPSRRWDIPSRSRFDPPGPL